MSRSGSISVNTQDIFPIIKKWLYSEHDIFIRELVANACDAITKRHTLARASGAETPTGHITIEVNKPNKTISIIDNGLGMSEEEIEKYIAQLAFSGAEEFVQKMKDSEGAKGEIIGKFGLGFYSAFMVASKVEVESLAMKEGSKAAKWTCEGETDYQFSDSDWAQVGTKITLHINKESEEFLDNWKTRQTLTRHCSFMPYSIELIDIEARNKIIEENKEAKKEEDKKPMEVDIINDTTPLWKKDPTSLKDEDYKDFYRKLFPMDPEPLFWLHLNVDHPFTLQGVLYFPKLNPNKPLNENSIKLYCKQVFVSENTKDIVPEFLGLLKGAIDSSDIPLNVSRSSLQGDPNVKKISNYIIKKVAESLKKIFKNDRQKYQTAWEDIGLFVKYGVVSDNKFDELMRDKVLFKNSENNYMTLTEYRDSIPADFKEKLGNKIITFEKGASDESLRSQLWQQKIHAIEIDNYIDPHFTQHVEFNKKNDEEYKFCTVDEELENLLATENVTAEDIKVKDMFENILGIEKKKKGDKEVVQGDLEIEVKKFKDTTSAAYYKIDQSMKRFQQMTKSMGNSAFSMPIKKTLIVNPGNPLIQNAYKLWEKDNGKDLAKKICYHVQDLASLSSEGLEGSSKDQFVRRSQDLIQELSGLAIQ